MHRPFFGLFLLLIAAMSLRAAPLRAGDVTIFAAASLKTALDEIAAQITATGPHELRIAYGGSAAMARQVAQGAGADIVILAHPQWMDWLEDAGHIQPATRCNLLGNRLVWTAQQGTAPIDITSAEDVIGALKGGRLALGNLRSVPAGQYAAAYFDHMGWRAALRPHLAETANVRLAATLVARGQAPLGLLYASDVAADPSLAAIATVPPSTHPAIRYPIALTANASPSARGIHTAISASRDTFYAMGFAPLDASEPMRCP